jgi:RsmE family RNA methyltransferase
MNIILIKPEDFIDTHIVKLSDYRHDHIKNILKAPVSSSLRTGIIDGKTGTGTLLECGNHSLMEVSLTEDPPPPLEVTLILALPRPKVLKRVVSSAVSMGVKRFHIINSWRVDKSYWYSDAVEERFLYSTVIAALEQSRDTVLPEIEFHRFFSKFVDDILPGLMDGKECLFAHPGSGRGDIMKGERPVVLVVGPEGGFIQREAERFLSMGFKGVDLGERILRVETAVTALLARLM